MLHHVTSVFSIKTTQQQHHNDVPLHISCISEQMGQVCQFQLLERYSTVPSKSAL